MSALASLDDAALRAVVVGYRDALRAHQEALNRLNVYPVPDGDTGTNMARTVESVVHELDGAIGMEATCRAISQGSLMGARGNSGVILSQLLRGLCSVLADHEAADAAVFSEALSRASASAYDAVMKPVEGTILTVAREAAEAADEAATGGRALIDVVEAASEAARAALDRTPELLPVLAEAGVVDAGGAGFVLLLDVMLNVADGRPVPEPEVVAAPAVVAAHPDGAAAGDDDLRYEVMFFLEAPDPAVAAFKTAWAELGDSIVVVGGDGLWNCHIHTGDIGGAIEAGIAAGRPRQIRVTDLVEQVDAHACEGPVHGGRGGAAAEHVSTAVVAVALGDGLERVFRELGAQQVVSGGQTMNPSTAEILEAVDACRAGAVVVLPNNSNVRAVADQVAALSDKPVVVVPTRGVVEGVAAMLQYDSKADVEANARSMAAAADEIVAGEVTRAVRAASTSAGAVAEGDWLGFAGGELVVVAPNLGECACALLHRLVEEHHELVTVIEGDGAAATETEKVRQWLEANRPSVTVEVHDWGHPHSAYLFSVE